MGNISKHVNYHIHLLIVFHNSNFVLFLKVSNPLVNGFNRLTRKRSYS